MCSIICQAFLLKPIITYTEGNLYQQSYGEVTGERERRRNYGYQGERDWHVVGWKVKRGEMLE